jgi:hypothetical protein
MTEVLWRLNLPSGGSAVVLLRVRGPSPPLFFIYLLASHRAFGSTSISTVDRFHVILR